MTRCLVTYILICTFISGNACAQTTYGGPDAGALNRTIQDDLMQLERGGQDVQVPESRAAPDVVDQKPAAVDPSRSPSIKQIEPVWSLEKPVPNEELLGAPIEKIFVSSPRLIREVEDLTAHIFYHQTTVKQENIVTLRRKIWDLFLQNGRLAFVTVRITPQGALDGPSLMSVIVQEVGARQVLIEGPLDKPLSEGVKTSIKTEVMQAFTQGNIINLAELDVRIQHRLRLGDYSIRLALVPVTPTQMDVKAIVSKHAEREISYLTRYDNSGMRSFGRDRLLGSVAAQQVATPGDSFNAIVLKTGDIGHKEADNGVVFGRVEYEAPVSTWGVRLTGWASAMHYSAIKAVTAQSKAQGESFELGGGVLKPLATSKQGLWDGRIDWLMKLQLDRFDAQTDLANKAAYEVRTQLTHTRKIDGDEQIQADAALVFGMFDLTGNSSSYQQDKAGAEVHGPFAKMTGNLRWSKGSGQPDSFDFAASVKAQAAVKNLDSMEKISLGGESGLRGFGSGEAMGDHGFIAQADTGYMVQHWLRLGVFYDIGWIQRYVNSFADDGVPLSYVLQNAGVGLETGYQGIQLKTTFAHQIGRNPGLTSSGADSDNVKRAYRLWASLSMRF